MTDMEPHEIVKTVLENLPEEEKAKFDDTVARAIESACESFCQFWDDIYKKFRRIVYAVSDAVQDLVTPTIQVIAEIIDKTNAYRSVATGREWHCYCYGDKKTQNKWQNEFERRLRKQNRRCRQ